MAPIKVKIKDWRLQATKGALLEDRSAGSTLRSLYWRALPAKCVISYNVTLGAVQLQQHGCCRMVAACDTDCYLKSLLTRQGPGLTGDYEKLERNILSRHNGRSTSGEGATLPEVACATLLLQLNLQLKR